MDKAKEALQACGQPNGFATNISYRAERPKEKATAESLQQSLARVGIKLTLKPLPAGDYFKLYAGKPDYAKANNLGLMVNGWGADWPDGFGFLQQIVDSRVIRAAGGNTNLSVKDPEVDAADRPGAGRDRHGGPREDLGRQIDKQVMEERVSCRASGPRPCSTGRPTLTNVFVNEASAACTTTSRSVCK